MTAPFDSDPVLVEVVRNGYVEGVHHGRVAVVDAEGRLVGGLGPEFAPIYPRSAGKPLQAVGLLRTGLHLELPSVALTCASHSGEEFHLAGVRSILAGAGLDESALQTPPEWPLDEEARDALIRRGGGRSTIAMNCSGKHAGMLAATARNGGDLTTYLDPAHPTQIAVLRALDDLSGEQVTNLAMDGCGAPAYAMSLYGLARAFSLLARATTGAEAVVAQSMREHPAYVSGTRRDELALHRAVPGLIGKAGAEGVYAVGLPDGRGVAIKVTDGSARARPVLMAGVLLRLGLDHDTLREQAAGPVLGRGERVGEIRPAPHALARLA